MWQIWHKLISNLFASHLPLKLATNAKQLCKVQLLACWLANLLACLLACINLGSSKQTGRAMLSACMTLPQNSGTMHYTSVSTVWTLMVKAHI